MRRPMLALLVAMAVPTALPAAAAGTLNVYTYEGFTADWGTGPQIEKAFEAECGCDVVFSAVTDGVALLNRVKLEGEGTKADIVLGLDTNLTAEAAATGLFAPHGVAATRSRCREAGTTRFPALRLWLLRRRLRQRGAQDAADQPRRAGRRRSGTEDRYRGSAHRHARPRPALWVKAVYGDAAPDAWEKLKRRVLTVTPGWSEAYGLFTKGEAPMVLSYTTSPAYHRIAEATDRYKAAGFSEGHYMQVEVAGITDDRRQEPAGPPLHGVHAEPRLPGRHPRDQLDVPGVSTSKPLDPAFQALVEPAKSLSFTPEEVAANRKAWVDEWLSVMSR